MSEFVTAMVIHQALRSKCARMTHNTGLNLLKNKTGLILLEIFLSHNGSYGSSREQELRFSSIASLYATVRYY